MDFDLKLKALSRLADSSTAEAQAALQKEIAKVATALETDTQFDLLEQQLGILKIVCHRASAQAVQILLAFIERLKSLTLSYSEKELLAEEVVREYHNTAALTIRAIEVLAHLRYLETKSVLHALIDLAHHEAENVRKKALEGLSEISSYKINVIYGDGSQRGIGVAPQKTIIEEISSLNESALRHNFSPVLTLANGLLSPTMHKTSWTYQTVTWSQGAVPAAPEIAEVRSRAIQLLERVYRQAVTADEKLAVIGALVGATRSHNLGQSREDSVKMIVRDTLEVLDFLAGLVLYEELPIVQKIEHHSYWIFYHAISPEVETAARRVEVEIANNAEYQIYRTLIGFEGIFGDWKEIKEDRRPRREEDEVRREKASAFASEITSENYPEWRQRILKYAETQSDDLATFPVFHYFLDRFAVAQPKLAIELLSKDTLQIERFMIPLIRALLAGPEREAVKALITAWVKEGQYLYPCIKQFLGSDSLDTDLLAFLLDKAKQFNDVNALAMVMSVTVANYAPDKRFLADRFFLPALAALTERSNADWVFDFWYRREAKILVSGLDPTGIDEVLRNLLNLNQIDYHAEEILYLVAEREPLKVLNFLCLRLSRETDDRLFDAIPFEFHKLHQPLSKIPYEAVSTVRATYDGNYGMFIFRGARLLHLIFPEFPDAFEAELLRVVATKETTDTEFVLAILRNYEGQPFIHQVCKEIVRILPHDSPLRTEVAIALEATGVVAGPFGFAEAYERKKEEVQDWLSDPDEKVQDFAKWYIGGLEKMSAAERRRAEEEITLRKHIYGE
jgi:hypothetical protein